MTKLVTVTVDDVEVRGPFTSKKGAQYDRHVFLAEGQEYFKFAGTEEAPLVKAGDNVQMLVDSTSNGKGQYNKIIEMSILGTKETTLTKSAKTVKEKSSNGKSTWISKGEVSKSTFDPKGARTGMIVKAALDLAIHNSQGNPVDENRLKDSLHTMQTIVIEAEKE